MEEVPTSPSEGSYYESGGDLSPRPNFRHQDRLLPIADISRVMKKGLPTDAKITMDAMETVQECASEFICFITSEASDKCKRENRKTINGDDIIWSLEVLGYEDYIAPLKLFLSRYRESETKVSAKGEESNRQDAIGGQTKLSHQGLFNQEVNYGDMQDSKTVLPIHGPE